MLTFQAGNTFAHRLDPRTKLSVQAGVATAALVHTTPQGLAVLTGIALVALVAARLSPLVALYEVRFVFPFLIAAPVLEGIQLGSPWFSFVEASAPALAGYRVILLILVSAAYVHTTPVTDIRAAVQWFIPGKPGQFIGTGVGFVFRFLPVLREDLRRIQEAMNARLGSKNSVREQITIVATAGLRRAFQRTDRFSIALRSRCFAWNPTPSELRFQKSDIPVWALTIILLTWSFIPFL